MKINKTKIATLLILVAALVVGCSFVKSFAVRLEYSLNECPDEGFSFPTRLRVKDSMVVASDPWETCPNHSHFEVYKPDANIDYFEIMDNTQIGDLYARIVREKSSCKLSLIVKKHCRRNTLIKECEETTMKNVQEADFKDLVQTAAQSLFYKTKVSIDKLEQLESMETKDGLEKWCSEQKVK